MTILHTVKQQLAGPAFTKLMEAKNTNKSRIAKATGVLRMTLYNWETGRFRPSDKNAEIVGRFLGLIPNDSRIIDLEKKQEEIKAELKRLK